MDGNFTTATMTPRFPPHALLHQAIAANQTYPESALQLNESGTVKIGFLIYPDGHLEQITVLQSSGIHTLDMAALNAVKNTSPVKEASQFLNKRNFFAVDIVFGWIAALLMRHHATQDVIAFNEMMIERSQYMYANEDDDENGEPAMESKCSFR